MLEKMKFRNIDRMESEGKEIINNTNESTFGLPTRCISYYVQY
jgi:hypothetical protein